MSFSPGALFARCWEAGGRGAGERPVLTARNARGSGRTTDDGPLP